MKSQRKRRKDYLIISIIFIVLAFLFGWWLLPLALAQPISEKSLEHSLGPGKPELLDYLKKVSFLENAALKFGKPTPDGYLKLDLPDGFFFEVISALGPYRGTTHIGAEGLGIKKLVTRGKIWTWTSDLDSNTPGFEYWKQILPIGKYENLPFEEEVYLNVLNEAYELAVMNYEPWHGVMSDFLNWIILGGGECFAQDVKTMRRN